MSKKDNTSLQCAKNAKFDEFYTQLQDIENELQYYTVFFKNKIVYCNCDNPHKSNFVKYFVENFNKLGLKKLIVTYYSGFPSGGCKLGIYANVVIYKIEINQVSNDDIEEYQKSNNIDILFNNQLNIKTNLHGNGDFRSKECVKLLKEADIIVTNPPFSLFREFFDLLIKYDKKFLILGNLNAITYQNVFGGLIKQKVWLGVTLRFSGISFYNPTESKLVYFNNIRWYTNLPVKISHKKLELTKYYNEKDYPKYDNYNAIEVSKVADIPCDYDGVMGVPITFLDSYNDEQFELLGITRGRSDFNKLYNPIKIYINCVQHNLDGTLSTGDKLNTGATLITNPSLSEIYYTADNSDKCLKLVYARLLIRRK